MIEKVGPIAPFAFAALLAGCVSNPDSSTAATTTTSSGTADAGAAAASDETSTDDTTTDPLLLSLAVSPLALSPTFETDVHDYAVRCAAGTNTLALALTGATGATLSVSTPSTTTKVTNGVASISLTEDQPAIVKATLDGVTSSYWIRCLPHDFPVVTFTKHPSVGTPTSGYYLTGNMSLAAGHSSFAMVLDNNGTPVWYKRGSSDFGVLNVDRLSDGTISYSLGNGPYGMGTEGPYILQSLTPWQTRTVQTIGGPIDEHELRLLPNGDVLTISYVQVAGYDLTGLGKYGANVTIADCTIEEISPTGDLVWSWRATDHIDPVKESVHPLVNTVDGVSVYDVFHFNSIEVDASGNLLLSARALCAVWYIDKATGKITWKLGGTAYNKDGAEHLTITGDPETTIDSQHDARFLANGDVTIFDDHTDYGDGKNARGVEYAIDLTNGTAPFVRQFEGSTWSEAMGSFRRYDDGSNLVSWGGAPKNPVAITEFDDSGNDVLDIVLGGGENTYRAVKVGLDAFDLDVLRSTAGHTD